MTIVRQQKPDSPQNKPQNDAFFAQIRRKFGREDCHLAKRKTIIRQGGRDVAILRH